jgi:hypothetical protein
MVAGHVHLLSDCDFAKTETFSKTLKLFMTETVGVRLYTSMQE